MNNEIITYNPQPASLLEMRADPNRFPRLKALTHEKAVYEMSKIVSQAFLYRGQDADPSNVQFISDALVTELMADTKYGAPALSLAEIQVVVKRAVLGGSEMFGISVASLYKVIMEFVKGEGHLNQKQVDQSQKLKAEKQLKNSVVSAMLQANAAEFIKNHQTQ